MLKRKIVQLVMLFVTIFSISILSLGKIENIEAAGTRYLDSLGNWHFDDYAVTDTSNYYSSLSGMTGQSFINELSAIITANTKKISYGSGTNETRSYMIQFDEDPLNSSNVLLMYSGASVVKTASNNTFNQEHTWAKSHGFSSSGSNAYSDLHHLRATYMTINSTRSNMDFGNVEDHSGTVKSPGYGNYYIANTIFEPRDEVKGDIARIMMYMDVRYAGVKSADPNLTLVNTVPTSGPYFGHLNTLLTWHNQDPVDDQERLRNDKVERVQGNRNPFVDHPEFIEQVYNTAYTGPDGGTITPPDPIVDAEKAQAVIDVIALIGTVTKNSEPQIIAAELAYSKLTNSQKTLVTNYQILVNARTAYNQLALQNVGQVDYEASFLDAPATAYTSNKTITLNKQSWFITNYYCATNDMRLGSNKAVTLPTKYNTTTTAADGSAVEMQWDISNVKSVNMTFGTKYGTISELQLLFSNDGGNTYVEVYNDDSGSPSQLNFTSPSGLTGRFALVIVGQTPRLQLKDVKITRLEKNNDFEYINSLVDELISNNVELNTMIYQSIQTINEEIINFTEEELLEIINIEEFYSFEIEFNNLKNQKIEELSLLLNQIEFNIDSSNLILIDEIEELLDEYSYLEDEIINISVFNQKINAIHAADNLVKALATTSLTVTIYNFSAMAFIVEDYNDLSVDAIELMEQNNHYSYLEELVAAYQYLNHNNESYQKLVGIMDSINNSTYETNELKELYSSLSDYEKSLLNEEYHEFIENLSNGHEIPDNPIQLNVIGKIIVVTELASLIILLAIILN